MIKISVTYNNFDNVRESHDVYFNLSLEDLVKIYKEDPHYIDNIQKDAKSGDHEKTINALQSLMVKSYGHREGNKFIKKPEWAEEFNNSPEMDAVFVKLLTTKGAFQQFITNVVPALPKDAIDNIQKSMAEAANHPEEISGTTPTAEHIDL